MNDLNSNFENTGNNVRLQWVEINEENNCLSPVPVTSVAL